MAVFLLKQPDAVFIHIPKTAGRSIRVAAWNGRYEGPVRGHVPSEWAHHFKFAFSRHPIERLLSGWRMFSEGRTRVPEYEDNRLLALVGIKSRRMVYRDHAPLFPALTIEQFLDIAEDDSVQLSDRTPGATKRAATLRRHAIPQTHPYNCIDEADFVGRFERIDEDMRQISARLGTVVELPVTNKTRAGGSGWQTFFTPSLYDRAVEYYRRDFERFGYEILPLARD